MNFDKKPSAREVHSFHNSLAILLKAVEGLKTTVDLRNEAYVYGTLEQADGFMNVVMKNCIFTDPRGNNFPFDTFFVHARNIRCVHIPSNIPVIPAIKNELQLLNCKFRNHTRPNNRKKTFKEKRTQIKFKQDQAAVANILSGQESKKDSSEPSKDGKHLA